MFTSKKSVLIITFLFVISFVIIGARLQGQMITGVWHGRIDRKKVELKIVQNGDSLTGTSYYYESSNNYRRYSIKGYFNPNTNSAIWWDDRLIKERTGRSILGSPGKIPYLSSADFNCPGGGIMMLNGDAALKENPDKINGAVDLEKNGAPIFNDEWDFVIENYTVGANDPFIIDSIANSISDAGTEKKVILPPRISEPKTVLNKPSEKPVEKVKPGINHTTTVTAEGKVVVPPVLTIEEKFSTRKKEITTEIPLIGDSIELRFYDNAEIDGDSISLFLNDKLVFQHIRLTAVAYTVKLPVKELNETNELVMVAENLGSIPPNTSYMVAMINNNRYDAMLKSTEETSAVIRLVKPKIQSNSQAKN